MLQPRHSERWLIVDNVWRHHRRKRNLGIILTVCDQAAKLQTSPVGLFRCGRLYLNSHLIGYQFRDSHPYFILSRSCRGLLKSPACIWKLTEENVIEAVRKYPCVYAGSEESYHDKTAKENAWNKVAEECDTNLNDIKKTWWLLRDNHRRSADKSSAVEILLPWHINTVSYYLF